jgi:putative ABC transport system ATP-binding protein
VIQLKGVGKVYSTTSAPVTALRNVDLTIRRGDFISLVGPSGSGKSTLLNLIGCLDLPTSGRLTFDGRETSTLSDVERSRLRNRSVGFVFQTFNLIPQLTVLENVELPLIYAGVIRGRRHRAMEAMQRVDIAHQHGQRTGLLSGGEQQRTAIARALVNGPELILADEPTGSVDVVSARQVLQILFDLHNGGETIVLVTHNPGVAAVARRAIRIVAGSLLLGVAEPKPATPLPPPAAEAGPATPLPPPVESRPLGSVPRAV